MDDQLSRLEAPKDPNFSMHCYDCRKGVDYNTGENYRSRIYCKQCFCASCRRPYDRAKRTTVTNPKTGHKVVICPKCFCLKCRVPIVNIPFIEDKGRRVCNKCSCQICNAAAFESNIDGKRHCQQCICTGCKGSLQGGFSIHNDYKYCNKCKQSGQTQPAPRGRPQQSSSNEVCFGCKKGVGDSDALQFDGKQFHFNCFKCKDCQKPFGHAQVFLKGNDKYCANCVAGTCTGCRRPIGAAPMFQIASGSYHETCFNCAKCKMNMPDGRCVLVNNLPHCPTCASSGAPATKPAAQSHPTGDANCWSCKKPFNGNKIGIDQLSHSFHRECFNCAHCSNSLAAPGTQVFVNADEPYCYTCMSYLSSS